MKTNLTRQPVAATVFQSGLAAVLLTLGTANAQTTAVPSAEQTAPAIPVDLTVLEAPVPTSASNESAASTESTGEKSGSAAQPVTDYTSQIGTGLKERERRLLLLNEAMMRLREAGETEDAARVEERIRALMEMPPPSQASTKLRAELEQLRSKNHDLSLQLLALQEELKRVRGNSPTGSRKSVASADR